MSFSDHFVRRWVCEAEHYLERTCRPDNPHGKPFVCAWRIEASFTEDEWDAYHGMKLIGIEPREAR